MKVTFYSVKKFKEYVDNVRKIQAEEIFENLDKISNRRDILFVRIPTTFYETTKKKWLK